MPTTILLIRHGETAWNREKIFRGTHDVPLNKNGRAQAALLAQALTPRIDVAYSSPLSRAAETAQIALGPQGITATTHQGLTDFNYGQWTGLQEQAVARQWPGEHALWTTAPHQARPPDGDTLQQVSHRSLAALEEIAREHAGQTIALFAHRVINKLLILGLLTLGLERFPFIRQDNCCLNEFQRTDKGYTVVGLNDVSHIRQAGANLLQADF
jgi:broad specificity phosphatase PhoE